MADEIGCPMMLNAMVGIMEAFHVPNYCLVMDGSRLSWKIFLKKLVLPLKPLMSKSVLNKINILFNSLSVKSIIDFCCLYISFKLKIRVFVNQLSKSLAKWGKLSLS